MINDNPSVFKDLKELFPDLSEKTGLTDEQMQVILENMYYLYHNLGLANIDVGNTTTNFTAPGVFSNTELSHREEEVNGTIVDYLDFKFNIPTPKIQTEIITNTVSTPDDVNIDIINYPIIETINGQNVTTGYKFSFRADLYKGEGLKQNEIISRDTISVPTIDTPDFVQDGEVLKYKKKNGDTYTYESFGGSLSDDYVTTNTEQSITATKTIELPMNVGNGYRGLVFKKGSGGGTAPKAMTFVDENDNSIAIVSVVSETIDFSGNVTFRNNLNSFSIDEVPTNIEITTNQSNKTITTALKNDSGTILSTSTANLPIENSFTEEDKENLDANTTSRHTHSNKSVLDATTASYTTTEKSKLSGIETGAQVNVQADWNESNTASSAYIKNKPTIPADLSGTVVTLDGTQTITGKKTFENIFSVQHNGVTTLNSILVDDYSIALDSTSGTSTSDIHQNKIDISNTGIQVITDNNTKFTYNGNEVATLEELNNIKNNILDEVYPVGSIYLSLDPSFKPPEKFGGEWTRLVFSGTLWFGGTDEEIGQFIEAGLPNITGQIAGACYEGSPIDGAFATINTGACTLGTSGGSVVKYNTFDASRSSSIYGNSDTVQPYAMRVALWQRTA